MSEDAYLADEHSCAYLFAFHVLYPALVRVWDCVAVCGCAFGDFVHAFAFVRYILHYGWFLLICKCVWLGGGLQWNAIAHDEKSQLLAVWKLC
jgi:hypothetical protein